MSSSVKPLFTSVSNNWNLVFSYKNNLCPVFLHIILVPSSLSCYFWMLGFFLSWFLKSRILQFSVGPPWCNSPIACTPSRCPLLDYFLSLYIIPFFILCLLNKTLVICRFSGFPVPLPSCYLVFLWLAFTL